MSFSRVSRLLRATDGHQNTDACRALSELDTAVARARTTESPSAFLSGLYKEITADFDREMHILTLTGAFSALECSEADKEDAMVI